jgi:CDP-paratose 2-epimerase
MKPRMLITGGAGFVGVNAARYFIERGWDVTILDNLSRRGAEHNLARFTEHYPGRFSFIKADIRYDQPVLDREAARHDAILHLAAQVAVTTSLVDPRMDFEVNALGTFNMLEAVRKAGTRPIVLYSSTNKVYGDLEELRINEQATRYELVDLPGGVGEHQQLDFHSPYGCSKGAADKYVRDYARIYDIPTVVFRQSCIYGPQQFGVEDQGWLAWFSIASLSNRPVTIYGTGKQVRDVLYIEDLLRLYEQAIERIARARGMAYNVGGGSENATSIIEFLDTLETKHEMSLQKSQGEMRQGDQKVFISDNTKVAQDLGWKPLMPINDGVQELVGWIKKNMDTIMSLYQSR